jgi:DNA polymerase III alpha subunit (gram-positive type)
MDGGTVKLNGKAITLTDHGSVQAFSEAADSKITKALNKVQITDFDGSKESANMVLEVLA